MRIWEVLCIRRMGRIILRSDAIFLARVGDQGEFVKKTLTS